MIENVKSVKLILEYGGPNLDVNESLKYAKLLDLDEIVELLTQHC